MVEAIQMETITCEFSLSHSFISKWNKNKNSKIHEEDCT